MFTRILLCLIFLFCGAQCATAGVMTSISDVQLDNLPVDPLSNSNDSDDSHWIGSAQSDAGMSAGYNATSVSQIALPSAFFLQVVLPMVKGPRTPISNATLPPCPFSDGLLKPS